MKKNFIPTDEENLLLAYAQKTYAEIVTANGLFLNEDLWDADRIYFYKQIRSNQITKEDVKAHLLSLDAALGGAYQKTILKEKVKDL